MENFNAKGHNPMLQSVDVGNPVNQTINFTDVHSNDGLTVFGSVKQAHTRNRSVKTFRTEKPFHSFGANYKAPSVDHKYKIKYARYR